MLSAGGKTSSLGTGGERAANRLKNDAVKTVSKETSGSREVFRDPGVMTGTRDFKATREQDRRGGAENFGRDYGIERKFWSG